MEKWWVIARRSSGRRRREGRTGSELVPPVPAGADIDSTSSARVASFSSVVMTCFAADIHTLATAVIAVAGRESFRTLHTNPLRFLVVPQLGASLLNKLGHADSSQPHPSHLRLETHSWIPARGSPRSPRNCPVPVV
jgi:hypothetical protein